MKWGKTFFLSFLVFLLFPLAGVFADSTPVDFMSGSNFESAFNSVNSNLASLQSLVSSLQDKVATLQSGLAQVQNNSVILFYALVVCIALLVIIAIRVFVK